MNLITLGEPDRSPSRFITSAACGICPGSGLPAIRMRAAGAAGAGHAGVPGQLRDGGRAQSLLRVVLLLVDQPGPGHLGRVVDGGAEEDTRRLRLPSRVGTIVQAESLFNDATSLVLFRLTLSLLWISPADACGTDLAASSATAALRMMSAWAEP